MLNYELDVLEIVISQSVVRRRLAMNEALKRRRAVVLVQGLARCWFAQMRLKELRLSQVQYQKETCSAVTLQVRWKDHCLPNSFRTRTNH